MSKKDRWQERYAFVENAWKVRRGCTVSGYLEKFGETNEVLTNLGERLSTNRANNGPFWTIDGVKHDIGGANCISENYRPNLKLGEYVAQNFRDGVIKVNRFYEPKAV
jgi:hypothetical protein